MIQKTYIREALEKYKNKDYLGSIQFCKKFQQEYFEHASDVSINISIYLHKLTRKRIYIGRKIFNHLMIIEDDPQEYRIAKFQLRSGYSHYGINFFNKELIKCKNKILTNKIRFELLHYYFQQHEFAKCKKLCHEIDDEIEDIVHETCRSKFHCAILPYHYSISKLLCYGA